MITLFVNDQKQEVKSPITLRQYLVHAAIRHEKGVAIAINDRVIPKSDWDDRQLETNDKLTIITATAGG